MLAKKRRLTTAEFDRYFKTGKRHHTPSLQVLYSKAADFHGAVVVGKKVSKKAVERNKLRRRVYNALYQIQKQNQQTGVFIVLVKPVAAKVSFSELKDELSPLLSQINKSG